ncbi:MAG: YibE/F family protein [Anaerocolumna sp.]
MAMLLWFKDLSYTFGVIINSKVFGAELIQILCSGLGATLIIPITAWTTSFMLIKGRDTD